MKLGIIYKIINSINNKIYIGQTRTSLDQRWKEHLRHAEYGEQIINRAMRKYNKENFFIEELEKCNIAIIDDREKHYIKLYNSTNKKIGYNVSLGGNTPLFNRPDVNIKTLLYLYIDKKLSLNIISKQLNISRYILKDILISNNINIRDRWESASKFNKINKEDLINVISKNSLRNSAKILNIPYSTLRKAIIYYNIEYNSSTSTQHPIKQDENIC